MKLLFYGSLADLLGRRLELETEGGCTIAQLRRRLMAEHPHAAETLARRAVRACVADSLVDDDCVIDAGGTVEFLPPLSGG